MNIRLLPQKSIRLSVRPPGDKSIAHRAVMLNSIAEGRCKITHFCGGADCSSTIRCMRALGARIVRTRANPTEIAIQGTGGKLKEPEDVLNAGNSGTTTRLLAGLLSGQAFMSIITGDASLRSRPMGRVIKPLRSMGSDIQGRRGGLYAPLVIKGGRLRGIEYAMPEPSAQVKSSVLLAGLFATGSTTVLEPAPTRDHTERMLAYMGVPITVDGRRISVGQPEKPLEAISLEIPGDISAAAYWLVAGAIHGNADVEIKDCGLNPTRTGIIDVLRAMGARISINEKTNAAGEPVGDLHVGSGKLKGVELEGDIVVRAIDEVPVIAVAACFAEGKTVIRSAEELRVKESDRIQQTVHELTRMGARIEELPDGMIIEGTGVLNGARVDSHGDHRLAMSLAVASLVARGETTIAGAESASISYPEFWNDLPGARGSQGASQ